MYLCNLVVRALHRYLKGVGPIPFGGLIVNEFFSAIPRLNFNMGMIYSRHIYPLDKIFLLVVLVLMNFLQSVLGEAI